MSLEKKLAKLICEYSLSLRKGDILLIRAETVSEPLIKEIYAKNAGDRSLSCSAYGVFRSAVCIL